MLADQLLTRRDQFVGRLALARFGGLQRHALLQILDARQGIVHRNDRLLRVGGRRGRIGLRRGGRVRGDQRDECDGQRATHCGLAKLTRVYPARVMALNAATASSHGASLEGASSMG